jgi:tetratricopeptide (TPR) repeat protein
VLLTAGLVNQTHPALWLWPTWSTGGDTASHVFYAQVFRDWVVHGKVSGWLLEIFAGLPAFSYYFPLPFVLIALLSFLLGTPVAFKLVSTSPAFLLLAATYWLGGRLHWPVATRLFAALGAAGFILNEETSIWGGNVLAELSGEFAYAWGMLTAVLFWGVLAWALEHGGRRWVVAALVEVVVALCHGYALLVAGFTALVLPWALGLSWRGLLTVLQVHALAFLLLGFWLLPLFETLPWTLPNDATGWVAGSWVAGWNTLWPPTLTPLGLGLVVLPLVWWRLPATRPGFALLLGIAALGSAGFLIAPRLGLADIRFFPYALWALAVCAGSALGFALAAWNRATLPWSLAVAAALPAWWLPRLQGIEGWSRWNLEGYQAKAMWPMYREVARVLNGSIEAPRVAFEHDPANNDLGSTRALEALPLFGSRPVLEGLYMESALSAPFIYQLQAEISARPSAPLNRFPSRQGSIDQAVMHMRELYVDTLLLRSEEMRARFEQDPRFEQMASIGPFAVLRLRASGSALVEPLTTPLTACTREHWLEQTFRRFLTAHPYGMREVYLRRGEVLPDHVPLRIQKPVRLVHMERERLVFETQAVGVPHLVRMSYHPRWHSLSGERILLTEPAFMLLVPRRSRVELVYGNSWADGLGWGLSTLGLVVLVASLTRRGAGPVRSAAPSPWRLPLALTLLLAISAGLRWNDPEQVYLQGHQYLEAKRFAEAAREFDRAHERRSAAGRRAEALFWSARSYEYAGEAVAARQRYAELRERYPESYWVPEALYRTLAIEQQRRRVARAQALFEEMRQQFPESRWTREASHLLGQP